MKGWRAAWNMGWSAARSGARSREGSRGKSVERRLTWRLRSIAGGVWRLDGRQRPEVAGCIDLDLNFSPSTNLLPIRRLELPVGGEARIRAAWLRFPAFSLEPLEQVYRRLGDRT